MQDLRIIKSRMAIENAFAELVLEKDFASVKVIDVTQRAGIDRHTFYRHYKNKQDLLDQTIQGFFQEYTEVMTSHPPLFTYDSTSAEVTEFLESIYSCFIMSKRSILRAAIKTYPNSFIDDFQDVIRNVVVAELPDDAPEVEIYLLVGISVAIIQYIIKTGNAPSRGDLSRAAKDLNWITTKF